MIERIALLLCVLVAVVACAPSDMLNATTSRMGYERFEDVAYGRAERQKMDVYKPERSLVKTPVLVFFHGGSWQFGDKADYRFIGQAFATQGFLVMIPNYRLYPDAHYRDIIADGKSAIRYAKAHAAEYGGDPERVYLMGHSAGAYNAMMAISYGPDAVTGIDGVIGLSGPYDFLPVTDEKLIGLFEGAQNKDAMPIAHVKPGMPPMLLMSGKLDAVVDPMRNTTGYANALKAAGNKVDTRFIDDVFHITMISALSSNLRIDAVFNPVIEFLRTYR